MAGSINAINGTSGAASSQAISRLTDATKKQLEALGVDTSSIKTESQGQVVLKAAKNTQATQGAKEAHKGNSPQDAIKEQAKSLASKLNITVSSKDDTNAILNKISSAISVLKTEAVGDVQKTQKLAQFQSEYNAIAGAVAGMAAQKQAGHDQINNSLNGMANYNKALLGL